MLRKLLPLTALLVASSAHGQDLQARYAELNKAMLRNSVKDAQAWVQKYCSADFSYTSRDGQKYNRKVFLEGLKQQFGAIKKVSKSTIKLGKPIQTAGKIILLTTSDFEGTLVFDGKSLTLTDKSETKDVWMKDGSDWKLRSIVQTKADTQMRQ